MRGVTTKPLTVPLAAIVAVTLAGGTCGDDESTNDLKDTAGTAKATVQGAATSALTRATSVLTAGTYSVKPDGVGGSGVTGQATLSAEDASRTRFDVHVDGAPDSEPVEVYRGTCDQLDGPPMQKVGTLSGGITSGVLSMSLDQVRNGGYAIVVQRSQTDTQPLACGTLRL